MKHIFFITVFMIVNQVWAATPTVIKITESEATQSVTSILTPITSPTTKIDEDAAKLKLRLERLASINETRRAISGKVTKIKDRVFSIENYKGEIYSVEVDNVATLFKRTSSNKPFTLSSIEPNQHLIVVGSLADKKMSAEEIYLDSSFVVRSGMIVKKNISEQSLEIITPDKDTFTIDIIGGKTVRKALNIKTMELEDIGFAAIKEGDNLHFTALRTAVEESGSRFQASTAIIIPSEYFVKGD